MESFEIGIEKSVDSIVNFYEPKGYDVEKFTDLKTGEYAKSRVFILKMILEG